MALQGKGFYIWQIPNCDGGDPAAMARRAKAAGLSHVMIKIADGGNWAYNVDKDTDADLVPAVADALRSEGVSVWGWQYVRGDAPQSEARIAVRRMQELQLEGFVIDAEAEYKEPGRKAAATRYMRDLRAGLPNIPIALSTYRFPRIHHELPYSEFLAGCDYAMPQVYFEGAHNPERQLEVCIDQYTDLRPARPIIPTAPTYARGTWRPHADEIRRFFAKAKSLQLSAANAWSWDFSTRPEFLDLWQAVADFEWDPKPPIADMPERLIGRLNQHDAVHVSDLYQINAAHVTAARTVVGKQKVSDWYQELFSNLLPNGQFEVTGKSGQGNSRHFTWTARSDRGVVLDGNDTLGMRDGRIQFHYTIFTIT